jgi:hypothetical protein
MSLKMQIMFFLIHSARMPHGDSQKKKNENDIEEIQKTPPIPQ